MKRVVFALVVWISLDDARAAEIRTVQFGTATLPAGPVDDIQSVVVTIAPFDPARSILWFGRRVNTTSPYAGLIRGRLLSENQIEFARGSQRSPPADVFWYLAEFSSGVQVQHIEFTLSVAETRFTVSPVVQAQSFVLKSHHSPPNDNNFNREDFLRAELTSNSELVITRMVPNSPLPMFGAWQLIEYQGASVQRRMGAFPAGGLVVVEPIPPVDISRTLASVTWSLDVDNLVGVPSGMNLSAHFQDSEHLIIARGSAEYGVTYAWETIAFSDGARSQSGRELFSVDESERVVTLEPVDPLRAIATLTGDQFAGVDQNTNSSGAMGNSWFTAEILTATKLRLKRSLASHPSEASWTVVEFPLRPTSNVPPDGGQPGDRSVSQPASPFSCGCSGGSATPAFALALAAILRRRGRTSVRRAPENQARSGSARAPPRTPPEQRRG